MSKLATLGIVAALVCGTVVAEELQSGPKPGEPVGMFIVEKVSGTTSDNVEVGKKLCYRCMLGNRPMVMVFARSQSKELAALVKELEATVPKHQDQKLASFVNMIGSADAAQLKKAAEEFGSTQKPEHLAVVVPADTENGPKMLAINPDADITVIMLRDGKVAAARGFAAGKLDGEGITSVISDTAKILKPADNASN